MSPSNARHAIPVLIAVMIATLVAGPALGQEPTDRAGWIKLIDAALESGKDQDALVIAGKAAKALPNDPNFRYAARWFERFGEKRIKEKGYDAGFEVAERALKVLPADEHTSIVVWRNSLYRYWSQELLQKKDFDGSLKVLEKGYALYPTDPHVQGGIAFHTQEALKVAEAKSLDAVIEQYQNLRKQFPKVEDIVQRGQRVAEVAVTKLVDGEKFKEAIDALERYGPLLPRPEQRASVGGMAYEGWALHLADKKEWESALAKYAEGLKAYPGHSRLLGNAGIIANNWARPAVQAEKWDEAIRIYTIAMKYLPDHPVLLQRKAECEARKKEKK